MLSGIKTATTPATTDDVKALVALLMALLLLLTLEYPIHTATASCACDTLHNPAATPPIAEAEIESAVPPSLTPLALLLQVTTEYPIQTVTLFCCCVSLMDAPLTPAIAAAEYAVPDGKVLLLLQFTVDDRIHITPPSSCISAATPAATPAGGVLPEHVTDGAERGGHRSGGERDSIRATIDGGTLGGSNGPDAVHCVVGGVGMLQPPRR